MSFSLFFSTELETSLLKGTLSPAMKPNVSKGCLNISPRVTRSTTTLDRNSLTLPVEVVTEILSRLPSKSVARCRCVCKLWSSVIRTQDFKELFLTKSCARPQLLFACGDRSAIHFFWSPQPENPEDNSCVVATNHIVRSPRYYKLFGCTNGFFCYGAERILRGWNKRLLFTVICNPSTGQSLTLPTLSSKIWVEAESYLGYDPIAKQFKVLSVCNDGKKKRHVLTLGTKKLSWRVVESCIIPHYSSGKWICISGVLYYTATEVRYSMESMVVCFDVRTEKFSFVSLLRRSSGLHSTTLTDYNGRLGVLMSSGDYSGYVSRSCKRFELWVLGDAAKHEWSRHVYVLPRPLWKRVVGDSRLDIAGMVGVNEIVLTPFLQRVPSYAVYYNVESKTIREVGIRGMEALQGKRLNTYLNYVENVKLL